MIFIYVPRFQQIRHTLHDLRHLLALDGICRFRIGKDVYSGFDTNVVRHLVMGLINRNILIVRIALFTIKYSFIYYK